jgi:predicted peptidase
MKRIVLAALITILFNQSHVSAQAKIPQLILSNNLSAVLKRIASDGKIGPDSTYKLLVKLNTYAAVAATGTNYKYFYNDAYFGKVPLQVYIPAGYKASQKTPCILMLHGAVGLSKFSDIDSTAATDEDILFDILKKESYIIIRPLGDSKKQFDWVINRFSDWQDQHANLTYKALNNIMVSLKGVLNIDDNRVFALGHSDGSDGALGLAVYIPNVYAGVVAYNSMLTNLTTRDFFIKNIVNRPAYIVHSELDNLRPMRMTRDVVNQLKAEGASIDYKEYMGYQHYDKHLTIDVPRAITYMNGVKRNPYPAKIEWTTLSDTIYNTCDWLTVTKADTSKPRADWDKEFNARALNKRTGEYYQSNYYIYAPQNVTVRAKYANNVFEIQTSRVGEVTLLISPAMVDLKKPVLVIVNGKQVFSGELSADKGFMVNNFAKAMDRGAVWVNAIKVKVD